MAKYIVFKPSDLNDDEVPSSSILWRAKFSIAEKFQELIPASIFELIDQKDKHISYPIAYWESEFKKLNFKKIYDFPFAKEFIWELEDELALTITINAQDINANHTKIIVSKSIAKVILGQMGMDSFGKLHPEKFYNKMTSILDLSEEEMENEAFVLQTLLELENLCEECVKYESFIEWKTY
jgi:hypothetical protein